AAMIDRFDGSFERAAAMIDRFDDILSARRRYGIFPIKNSPTNVGLSSDIINKLIGETLLL
ncbi:hypothetical protein, partial [Filibacter tadaridae]|uniref:hypothetical protein n=1 Tax=Filibacter tadaridae TaxID=2483811 RepID=UPI0039EBFC4B